MRRSLGLLGDTNSNPVPLSTRIGADPALPDQPLDKLPGPPGLFAGFLRSLFARFLPPWFVPPPGYRSFDIQHAIATPAAPSAPTVVLSRIVPTGFVMFVKGLSIVFSGGGFNQGSGDIIYTIRINGAPVKGYGNILTDLGTMQPANVQPREVSGIFATSGQLFEILVTAVNPLGGGTQVVATIVGYDYPQQYHTTSWSGR